MRGKDEAKSQAPRTGGQSSQGGKGSGSSSEDEPMMARRGGKYSHIETGLPQGGRAPPNKEGEKCKS
jgi:hypothetical protein